MGADARIGVEGADGGEVVVEGGVDGEEMGEKGVEDC